MVIKPYTNKSRNFCRKISKEEREGRERGERERGREREREQAFKNYSFKLEAKWIFFINKRKVTKEILIVNFEL